MCAQVKRSVLVVEDETILRRMICAALEMKGLAVLQASNGLEALDQLSRHRVDLLLTDWNMPEMNGRELLARVRGKSDNRKLPVIVLSGNVCPSGPADENRIFDRWLKKPFLVSEVQRAVVETINNAG